MPETIRTNFTYDPVVDGYNTSFWKTLAGVPTTASGRLVLSHGEVVHYGDILRGEVTFNVNDPSGPGAGIDRLFGLYSPTETSGILFSIGATLTVYVSDGVNTTVSDVLEWNPLWTGAPIKFKIQWEGGEAKFFIDGTKVATIPGANIPTIALPIYLKDDSATNMSIGDIDVSALSYCYFKP